MRSFFILAVLLLAGCAAANNRNSVASEASAIPHDVSYAHAQLAAALYPRLAADAEANDNLFISPLSLTEGLGLALIGARGTTETQLRELLAWSGQSKPERLVREYGAFLSDTGEDEVRLSVANALWLSRAIRFDPSYLNDTERYFGATAEPVDFGGDPLGAARRINGWVAQATRERIEEIVSADQFDQSTAAVLTNAVWFKADWSAPFKDGAMSEYTRGDGSRVPIYMMERIERLQYRESKDGQAVVLPYGSSGRFVMEIFLPRNSEVLRRWERDISALSFSLASQGSDAYFDLGAEASRQILLRLPRFEARFENSVRDALVAAGIPCAFDKACADFSGMADAPFAISEVAHATFLRVDETGTEASASTAIAIRVTAKPPVPDVPKMIVDRPFLVAIRDRASGALIFFGRIADPMPVEAT